jgi:hypothetical protein
VQHHMPAGSLFRGCAAPFFPFACSSVVFALGSDAGFGCSVGRWGCSLLPLVPSLFANPGCTPANLPVHRATRVPAVVLLLVHHDMPSGVSSATESINIACTIVFTFEAYVLIWALGAWMR